MTVTASAYDFEAIDIQGHTVALADYRGKVLLIVNTASACGFTPQLSGLESLHRTYSHQGLVVLGFPCNQFGGQEPGDENTIAQFCSLNHGVSFPLMRKVDVNGPKAPPLYQWLTQAAPGLLGTRSIKWNFTKFLIGRDGQPIARFAPQDTPGSMAKAIESALNN